MFNKMDTDKDGIVTIEELKAGLRDFGTQLAESEVQMLIEAVHIFFPSISPFITYPSSLKYGIRISNLYEIGGY